MAVELAPHIRQGMDFNIVKFQEFLLTCGQAAEAKPMVVDALAVCDGRSEQLVDLLKAMLKTLNAC